MTSDNKAINSNNWINRINETDDYIKDMMSFYNVGWDARGEDDKRKIKDRIKANIVLTFTYVDEIINALTKLGIDTNCVYLKVSSFVEQTVLFTIPLESYLKDEFSKIYSVSSQIEKSSRSENYSVGFSFTFDEGDLDETSLIGDGFQRTHIFNK